MNIVQAQFELLRKKSSSSAHVLVAYGGRGRAGAKRGGKSGGRGWGGDNNGNSSRSQKDGESGAAAGAEKQPAKGPMGFNCRGRGHHTRDCTVKLRNRCHTKGHEESNCPSPPNMRQCWRLRCREMVSLRRCRSWRPSWTAAGLQCVGISKGPLWHQASLLVAFPLVVKGGWRWHCRLGMSGSRWFGVWGPGRPATCKTVATNE